MSDSTLVRAAGLTVAVAGGRRVVDDVALDVASGECVGLVGESGSGKSMTLRALIGVPPDGADVTGEVLFDGATVTGRALAQWRADHLGMVFQDPRAVLDPTRPVGDYVGAVLRQRGKSAKDTRQAVVAALDSVGVPHPERAADRLPHAFSGGQLQRIVIAGALVHEPRLLVADEPTTALDNLTQARVMALLQRARRERGLAMIFVTHNLELALAICDRLVIMYAGRVLETVTPEQVRRGETHPYSQALLACKPDPDVRVDVLPTVEAARAQIGVDDA